MYSLLQAPIDEMNPALLEMAAVLEVIICPYAPKIVKIYLSLCMYFIKSFQRAKLDHYYILLDFLCNFRITRFIHFSGLLNPGKSLPPAIGSAKDMNTEKREFD